jgi:hypothetical protein
MTTRRWCELLLRAEPWIIWALGALALAAVPILQGGTGIIWDALNHHIYLGWISEHPRFDRDFLAANWQSYQFPYLYWPAYKLAVSGVSGVTAGVVLAMLQSVAVPALWLVARSLCPGDRWEDIAWRALGVAFALAGGLTISLADTTSNDLMAGIPLLWAITLALMAHGEPNDARRSVKLVALSGLLAGLSVACKLSNGPLALIMPALWVMGPDGAKGAAKRASLGSVATVIGFLVGYGWWGWEMWQQFGNPIYPFADASFDPVRALLGWQPS